MSKGNWYEPRVMFDDIFMIQVSNFVQVIQFVKHESLINVFYDCYVTTLLCMMKVPIDLKVLSDLLD